jgi:phosphotransferase system HPr (HPr) family protein
MQTSTERHTSVTVEDRLGLHLRVAQQIVLTAQRFQSTLTICKGSIIADAKSILSVLMLGAVQGTVLDLHASGGDAEAAIYEIAHLIDSKRDDH